MSAFYDLASLVLVPSGYKASKVYAQKPLTTDGQLSFSRASTATRVNSAGLIETVSSNVPRLDYLGSTCPKLLLEPQRTNLLLYSEQFDNAYWQKDPAASVTANAATSPDGSANADRLSFSSANAIYRAGLGLSGAHRFSVYLKGEGANIGKEIYLEISGGTSVNVTLTGSWQRFTAIADNASSVAIKRLNSGQADSVLAWGAQLELGAYATSYIPTTTAAVTRTLDQAYKIGISSLIGQTEGTFFAEFTIPESQSPSFFSISNGTPTNRIIFGYYQGVIRYYTSSGTGSFSMDGVIDASPVVGQTYKIAIAYKANDFKVYKNGSNTNTETTFTVPASLTALDNAGGGVGQNIYAGVNQLLLFKTRLTNAQLAELTAL